MPQTFRDWLTVVDARGRFMAGVVLAFAFCVSLMEIAGAAIVAMSIQLATQAATASVSLPVVGDVEDILPGGSRASDLRWMAAVGSAFFVARGVAVVAQQYVAFRAAYSLGVRLTDRVMERLLRRDYSWHLSQNSAELSSMTIAVTQSFVVKVFSPAQTAGAQLLTVLSLSLVAIAVEPVGAIGAVVAIGGVMALSLWLTRRQLIPLGEVELTELALSQRLTTESFQGIREIKLLDLSESARQKVWASRRRWSRALRRSATIVAAPRTVLETVAFCSLIALLAARGNTDSQTAVAGIGVLGYAVIRILPTANNVVTHVNTIRSAQASMRRLADILRGDQDGPPPSRLPRTADAPLPIEAHELSFSYPSGETVLDHVELRIERGSSVGIVGATGCGKSTLLDLLAGLLTPTEGSVTLNGKSLEECRPEWWAAIGFVPQTITLLDSSLAENVALGVDSDDIDAAALGRALDLAQMQGVVAGLSEGAATEIGERGVRLSGGQRQRLAIARALYRDPPVIFLDEGTSALDAATERLVIGGLRSDRPDRTLVMVAHRTTTLRDCDQILVLDAGRVVSRGEYSQLMETCQRFRELAAADPE